MTSEKLKSAEEWESTLRHNSDQTWLEFIHAIQRDAIEKAAVRVEDSGYTGPTDMMADAIRALLPEE